MTSPPEQLGQFSLNTLEYFCDGSLSTLPQEFNSIQNSNCHGKGKEKLSKKYSAIKAQALKLKYFRVYYCLVNLYKVCSNRVSTIKVGFAQGVSNFP